MKPRLMLFAILLICSLFSFGYNNLYVNNPQGWNTYQGVIENAEITVRPVGAFVEYAITLTISGNKPINEDPSALLEIVMDFDLPSNSMITDSWLWMEGVPKQAEILDRWTASAIYESIVNRRKDPSLLVKNEPNSYRINIYPMKPTESRTFKMVYLSPAKYSNNHLMVEIPSNILELSGVKLEKIDAYILSNEFYGQPASENSSVTFSQVNHEVLGNCVKAVIPNTAFSSHMVQLESINQESIKLYQYGNNDEGFYQISFVPSELVTASDKSQKICYVVDFDKNYSRQDLTAFLTQLAYNIERSIGEKDYFNIIFSSISPNPSFDNWVSATPANIQQAFSNANIANYSNFITSLGRGIEFINSHGGDGKLILISNNCSYNNVGSANSLLTDIDKINVNKNQIDVIDFAEDYYFTGWIANNYYYNNSYFFNNLARKYSGEYIQFYTIKGYTFNALLENAISQLAAKSLKNIDIYTSNANGFCYGRMTVSNSLNSHFNFNKSIYHLGKYKGGFPTSLEVAFEMDGELQHFKTNLTNLPVINGDSVIKTIWSGIDISQLETQGNSNQIIGEIIYQSIENRILSTYTAFLCVEDSIEICEDCGDVVSDPNKDWEVVTSVENQQGLQLKTYPNPFTSYVEIELPASDNLVELKIFNALGQCVKNITVVESELKYSWDGLSDNGDEVKAGIYLVIATYRDKVMTTKIMKR